MSRKLPEGWIRKKIKELPILISDGNYSSKYPKADELISEGIPFIRVNNLQNNTIVSNDMKYISQDKHDILLKGHLKEKDVLITVRGDLGKVAIVTKEYDDANINAQIALLRITDSNIIDSKFLLYSIKNPLVQLEIDKSKTGSALKQLPIAKLKEIYLNIPPLEQQEIIVSILERAESAKQKRKESLKILDELVKSRFIDMFGDPVKNTKGWEMESLSELGTLGRGVSKHRPRNAPELLGGDYPLIQTGDVANSGLYIKEYNTTYSELGLKQSKLWDKGTLCITIAANIAKTGILDFDACFPDSVVGFVAGNKTNNIFMNYWFASFQKLLEEQAPESAQKNINLKILSELKVIIPPIELQNEFADFVKQVDKLKFEMENSLKELENNFNALMQKAFKGELF